jgi:hypothetical protein
VDVKDTNSPNGDSLLDEVEVDLHILGALMLHKVGEQVDGAHIAAVHKESIDERVVQLLVKLPQQGGLGDAIGNNTVFVFSTGPRNRGAALGRPGDEAATEKDRVAEGMVEHRVLGQPAQSISV